MKVFQVTFLGACDNPKRNSNEKTRVAVFLEVPIILEDGLDD